MNQETTQRICARCKNYPGSPIKIGVCTAKDAFVHWDFSCDGWTPPETKRAETTDPKGAAGAAKSPLHLLPPEFLHSTAKVLALGGRKYGPWNWRNTSSKLECQTYVAAILRHVMAYQDGEDTDQESGESHIAHIAASCAILIDAAKHGTLHDNRPTGKTKQPEPTPKNNDAEWLRTMANGCAYNEDGNVLRAIADKLERLEGGAE